MQNDRRKSLYFMPYISIKETIEIKELRLIKNECQHDEILPDSFKGGGGIFIELIDIFKSVDFYDIGVHSKIKNSIELLKFSFYTICVTMGGSYPGFISESTFELFPIIEANKNKMFEHKTEITNGMTYFLMKQEDYYRHRIILGNNITLELLDIYLHYFKLIYDECIDNEDKLSIISLYNKCLRITNTIDCFDKVIFARASIETMIKLSSELTKPNYIEKFVYNLDSFIKKNFKLNDLNDKLYEYYEEKVIANNGLEIARKNLNDYLKYLADARHSLVHENKVNQDFKTIEVYIAWFPIFFLITFFEDKLDKIDVVRYIFFLKLLQLDVKKWMYRNEPSKMTCLEVYSQYSITIAKNIHNDMLLNSCLKGFNKCFCPPSHSPRQ